MFHRILVLLLAFLPFMSSGQAPAYKNPRLTPEVRTRDLLSRMTVEEKIGQLLCPMGWEMYAKDDSSVEVSSAFRKWIDTLHAGTFWGVYRADPWTRKTLENGLNPELAARAGNALQQYVMENTRLGIPLFLAEESPHGHMAIGTTVFPTGIGQAATWNPELIRKAAGAMAKEVRLQGAHISYGSLMDLSSDPRWSWVDESFGEDPVLTSAMGVAAVQGGGGGDLSLPYSVISTLKHFIAYGIPEGGHNGNTALVGERELYENFFPPFRAAVEAGALSVMTAYNSIDGVPCTANPVLYRDLLKREWGFEGFVVSDLFSINGLSGSHRVAGSLAEAGEMALAAGVDMDLGASGFAGLKKSLEEGRVTAAQLDEAVGRVLKLKFAMGLFENPYVSPEEAGRAVRSPAHISLAREVARESVVLLENRKHTLPLSARRIAVIGPNAHNRYNQLGDYTAPQEDRNIVTVYEGIKRRFASAEVTYVKGVAVRDTVDTDIPAAVQAAREADVAVVVVGGSSARDFQTEYKETGAAVTRSESVQDMENGEGFDRATLQLLGKQQALLEAVRATGTPLVVIYIQGRPMEMNWAAENADALLTAWYPGQEGGNALADVLAGDVDPSGRLPISVPRSVGQLPVYYNRKHPSGHDYVEMPRTPLYAFGYGKSYTTFAYRDLGVSPAGDGKYEVSFRLENTGKRAGKEVVQLYLRDEVASVVQPLMQLRQFQKIELKPGETREVRFVLGTHDLEIVNKDMRRIVEPGAFTVMIGAASSDIRLQTTFNVP